jgi:colanic acid/amylovoran biosynthesis glycosyltransferase
MTTHVCYIVKRFPRLSQTFVLNELLALERQGVRLTVISLRRSDEAHSGYAELAAPVLYLGEQGARTPAVEAAQIAPLLLARGVTHIHAHFATRAATVASLASAATGVPFSFTAHAHDIFHAGVDCSALAATMARAATVVTVSEYNRRYLEGLLAAEGRTGRVLRLYNGVDLSRLRPAAGPRRPGLIVGVGRLIAKKGFATLVEALRLLRASGRRAGCLIVGEGEERARLQEQIVAAGLVGVVRLAGALAPAQVARLVGEAEVFALPCVVDAAGDRDGMPTVLVEAMALGTPVVSTDVAGIPELVQHGRTGLLAAEGDPASLAAALATLLDDAALRERLRAAALACVRADFDLERNVLRLRGLFQADALATV